MAVNADKVQCVPLTQTWGPIDWDGTARGMQRVLDAMTSAGAPATARLTIANVSYTGARVTATFIQSDARMY